MKGGRILYDIIIWVGVVIFVALTIAAVLLYFQNERFDEKYKKNIEIIRAIKIRKLRDLIMGSYEQESHIKDKNTGNNFPVNDDFKELAKKILESNKNLNRMMRKSADLKMWFDYLPRAKDFLVSAALWLFLLSLAVLAFCLALWAEFETVGGVRYSGYLSFILILMGINLFKNILRYNLVTKNINKHMNMIREGEVEKF